MVTGKLFPFELIFCGHLLPITNIPFCKVWNTGKKFSVTVQSIYECVIYKFSLSLPLILLGSCFSFAKLFVITKECATLGG